MEKTMEPSVELLEQCKEGDKVAFREIFYMYRSYAYNLIYKITGPYANHEDLIQEAFFQIYLSLKKFKGNSSFKTWFHRIVIHVCTRAWRYQNAEKRIADKDTVDIEKVEYCLSSDDSKYAKKFELKDLVEKALDTLDKKLRVPLVLHIYSEFDLEEIAVILGIPEGTVKSRLFTARKKIRHFLDECDQ
jgi:RNA polymerase sigma-70 factor (ECF subfamily)